MSKSDASAQADTSRITRERKYFSCGFCVSLFDNIADQLNHIDTQHFRNLQDISGWNISNVIQGLMQQPGVRPFWQGLFGARCHRSQDVAWNDSVAEDLQLRLELGEESAKDLAWAAISQVTGGFTYPHTKLDQNMLSSQDRATVTPAYSRSITTNTSSGMTITHEVSNKIDISSFYTQSTIPQILYGSALASYNQTNQGTQPIFHQSESSNSTQSYTAPPMTPIRSPSVDGGHGPGAPGHLAFTLANIPTINSEQSFPRCEEDA